MIWSYFKGKSNFDFVENDNYHQHHSSGICKQKPSCEVIRMTPQGSCI